MPSIDSGGGPLCAAVAFWITVDVSLVGSRADDASAAFGEAMLRVVLVSFQGFEKMRARLVAQTAFAHPTITRLWAALPTNDPSIFYTAND